MRVKCIRCDNMILEITAKINHGLCMPCKNAGNPSYVRNISEPRSIIPEVHHLEKVGIAVSYHPDKEFLGIELLEPVLLSKLGEIIGAGEYNDLIDAFSLKYSEGEDGPWATEIPKSFVDKVTNLPAKGFEQTAKEWAESEEFKLNATDEIIVQEHLIDLRRAFRMFKQFDLIPYLWMSL